MARRLLNVLNGLLNLVTMIVVVAIGAYAGYALWDNEQIYATAGDVQADMLIYKKSSETEEESPNILFDELKAINPDVSAWLTIDNTMIDYPVLYGETNSKYLNHNVYGEYALAGSIFVDYRVDRNFHDPYSLLHGHNMSGRRMFGDIILFKDETFFNENRTGVLVLEDRVYNLRTYAFMIVSAVDRYIFMPEESKVDIEELLLYSLNESVYKDEEQINRLLEENRAAKAGDRQPQILSMATCSNEYTDARAVLLAEMIPVGETE